MSVIYLAGPITLGGLLIGEAVERNYAAFHGAAARLRLEGHEVWSPVEEIPVVAGKRWADYMREGIALLLRAERIHLLPGWRESQGARLEYLIARELAYEVTFDAD